MKGSLEEPGRALLALHERGWRWQKGAPHLFQVYSLGGQRRCLERPDSIAIRVHAREMLLRGVLHLFVWRPRNIFWVGKASHD